MLIHDIRSIRIERSLQKQKLYVQFLVEICHIHNLIIIGLQMLLIALSMQLLAMSITSTQKLLHGATI